VMVSSRASMVGSLVAAACYFWCRLGKLDSPAIAARSRHIALGILLVVAAGSVLLVFDVPWVTRGLEAMLKLNDPYRGISTGASGRTDLWAAALALWEAQPLLGVGFRGHESLMPDGSPAHNAYLSMLAETGVLGFGGYLLICGSAVAGLVRLRHDPTRQVGVALAASYIVYGFVESRAVSFGNPYSIVFLWIALDASRRVASGTQDSLLRVRLNTGDAPRPPTVSRSEGST
jgi:exopolysaccharide production protein ExoQ